MLQSDWLPYALSVRLLIVSAECKQSNSTWRPFPAFPADVSEEELNALIQKAILEKND